MIQFASFSSCPFFEKTLPLSEKSASDCDLTKPSPEGEFSIYVHLPFCQRKCPYCHFYVLTQTDSLDPLIQALGAEWRRKRSWTKGQRLRSVYFGGGTPSLFKAEHFERLLSAFEIDGSQEVTVEINPEHAQVAYLRSLVDKGVNRISLGAQSLNARSLKTLGRRHTPEIVLGGVESARRAGLDNISLDLMFDLPDQTLHEWRRALQTMRDWPITHLSIYNLTIEPGTPFFRRQDTLRSRLPSAEISAKMFQLPEQVLDTGNWTRYELSAYCRGANFSIHNTGYWRGRSYLGLGPSAWSFWGKKRTQNPANLRLYLQNATRASQMPDQEEDICETARVRELFLIHLRISKGIDLAAFATRWGPAPGLLDQLVSWIDSKYLGIDGDRLYMTAKGQLFYDTLAADLI